MTDSAMPQPAALADAREEAIRVLTDRYADDTLTSAEFERRLDRLYATETPAAAHGLVSDLLQPRPTAAPVGRPRAAPSQAPAAWPADRAPGAEEVLAVFGQRAYVARRHQSERLSVRAFFSAVTLDLRELPPGAVRDVEVHTWFSDVRVLLPADAELDANVSPVLGNVTDDATHPWHDVGGAHVRLRGLVGFSELSVRRTPAGLPFPVRFQEAWKEAGRAVRRARKALTLRQGL